MAKIALFFLLDRARMPENFGMKLSIEATAPLYDTLIRDCRLTKLPFSDSCAFCLRLFHQPFNTDLLIIVKDLDSHSGSNILASCSQQAAEVLDIKADQPFYHGGYLARAMWLPRGVQKQEFSHMLNGFSTHNAADPSDLPRLDSRGSWIMNHPDGFIFGSKNEADFVRGLLLYGLGMAYHYQFSQALNRLSLASGSNAEQLRRLLEDIYRFQGQYYFSNPVRPSERQDSLEYLHLTNSLGLQQLQQQLELKTRQLSALVGLRQVGSVGPSALSEKLVAERREAVDAPEDDRHTAQPRPRRWLFAAVIGLTLLGASSMLYSRGEYPPWLSHWITWSQTLIAPAAEAGPPGAEKTASEWLHQLVNPPEQ